MKKYLSILTISLLLLSAIALSSCSEEDAPANGRLEVTATWTEEVPEASELLLIVMSCPFTMPPEYSSLGTIEEGTVTGAIEDIEPSEWCLQAYIDVDPDDGLVPKPGYDVTLVLEDGAQSLPVTIVEGETTSLTLEFEMVDEDGDEEDGDGEEGEDGDGEETEEQPGADDVWIKVNVECETCSSDISLLFYGYPGTEMGTIPLIYNEITSPEFPLTFIVKETGPLTTGPVPEGQHLINLYQDLDTTDGPGPQAGDPIGSEDQIVDLKKGTWNEFDFTME